MIEGGKIFRVNIEEEMKSSYIDYAMSVIVSRALPDVRDGLKPVHRRVLFGMNELGNTSGKPYKKSARIVGEVLGKYHPHGDTSVYDAMVRMAQEWSLRYPLVDGQGNFGSVDGDSPAAMRYTEARLKKIAEEMLADLEKNTVDFKLNFDDTLEEPTVLPAKFPNLLVNGASGIAVGMATNMAPHNLTEVINATIAYIDNHEITIPELMRFIKAPDFPTGGIIYGYQGVKEAFETGRGRIVMRAKANIETEGNRDMIVINKIPYQINKAELIKKIADLVNDKKIEGISNVNDESDRQGMRIVVDLKRDANANVVLNTLFKQTALQTSFSVNNICLVNGRPKQLNLKELIHYFVEHRHEVVIRRTKFELDQAEKKAHILQGLLIALDHIDEVIKLIRASKTVEEARDGLMKNFALSELQARAILDMRLQKLTGLERENLKKEYEELMKLIEHLKTILADESLRMKIIKDELIEIREKYGDERRTEIVYASEDFNPEDFYADEDVVITISHLGYIKRTQLTEYRVQNRGGIGSMGSETRDEDYIEHVYIASMHNTLLLFTEKGKCFWLKVYELPEGNKNSKGRAIQNILNIDPDDKVRAYVHVSKLNEEDYVKEHFIVLCTLKGVIKKTTLQAYARPRSNGIIAINIRENDQLIEAKLTNGKHEIIIANRGGRAIRFNESKVRPMGRGATGVRAIRLVDEINGGVVGMVCIENETEDLLVVSENGYGKRSKLADYPITNRGGKGVKAMNVTEKTGKLIAIKGVLNTDDLMIINKSGVTIRIAVKNLRLMGRATQGVRLISLRDDDSIASVTYVEADDKAEVAEIDGEVLDDVIVDEPEDTNDTENTDNDASNNDEKTDGKDFDNETEK
ncbi:MAG: DNA gyrase subunit A [Bacteroidetes bacterium CG02_land_8_20_14_3_00_31_25]|nr:MAG: DNA gyrase subunit A [Bacteroidetes bacterium CG02_land_8_20_14_3_00_31_25]PIX36115.1 MAG: DNA gyrase subunit A [Bacteroidetes bacterium CG_4_8_14_3_um_filter_31_14]PIY07257.1 MAG: DNA gyrase subunit A [Bacteroidetes bacterium CG_4_10_14_3_um_filter_31_20]